MTMTNFDWASSRTGTALNSAKMFGLYSVAAWTLAALMPYGVEFAEQAAVNFQQSSIPVHGLGRPDVAQAFAAITQYVAIGLCLLFLLGTALALLSAVLFEIHSRIDVYRKGGLHE